VDEYPHAGFSFVTAVSNIPFWGCVPFFLTAQTERRSSRNETRFSFSVDAVNTLSFVIHLVKCLRRGAITPEAVCTFLFESHKAVQP
jgi:hypothetical protein